MPDAVISTHTLTWSVTGVIVHYLKMRLFQLTRSRGAWRVSTSLSYSYLYFNSHAHVERDKVYKLTFQPQPISTHTLTWSVTSRFAYWSNDTSISTHTLTWSVTFGSLVYLTLKKFQLTRSRGAWPVTKPTDLKADKISTHTLTWSVTTVRSFLALSIPFQLTRSRGAWL